MPFCETHAIPITRQTVADDPISPRTYEVSDHGKKIALGVFYGENQEYSADLFWGEGDDELVLANKLDPRFPKWVFYTWEPNHVETSYLTRQQKDIFLEETQAVEMLDSITQYLAE